MRKPEVCNDVDVRLRSHGAIVCVADREVQRILLELLNQMDGFDQSINVKVEHIVGADG